MRSFLCMYNVCVCVYVCFNVHFLCEMPVGDGRRDGTSLCTSTRARPRALGEPCAAVVLTGWEVSGHLCRRPSNTVRA